MEQTFTIKQLLDNQPDGMGGTIEDWVTYDDLEGFLDLFSGTNRRFSVENAIVEQSSHILIVPEYRDDLNDRMKITDESGRVYKITLIDNPVGLNDHLEIYLELDGGASG